jgi:hypothetical protein
LFNFKFKIFYSALTSTAWSICIGQYLKTDFVAARPSKSGSSKLAPTNEEDTIKENMKVKKEYCVQTSDVHVKVETY